MQITFYGGAGGVTGSKHLLDTGEVRILFDCGTFQGLPDVRERNRGFPFPPDSIDLVILSHAHIDHCGMLPLLVKRGFKGKIFSTPATADIARRMLKDMARIEEQDAFYHAKHKIGAPDEREPLFTANDIPETIEHFKLIPYDRDENKWHKIAPNIRLKFYDAGHIIGSSISLLEIKQGSSVHHLAYTGDLGALNSPLLHDPEVPNEDIQTLIIESTYGNRDHKPLDQATNRLAQFISLVAQRGGKIIIPAFSLGRTQAIVYALHKLTDTGAIPRLSIYVDSPLASDLTEIFRSHRHDYDKQSETDFVGANHKPLFFSNLIYTRSAAESKKLNNKSGPFIIISASGMMTAGRVVHHLRHSLADKKNAILITGYQATGTLGRRLLEGAKRVEIYGDWFPVNATIEKFNEFSAHADRQQILQYIEKISGLQKVILVHGEPQQADQLALAIKQKYSAVTVERPDEGDTVAI